MTTKHKCIIAVPEFGEAILVKSDPILDELFDGPSLDDNYVENVPEEPGIYECTISVTIEQCNHPLDPVEYDAVHSIDSYFKVI